MDSRLSVQCLNQKQVSKSDIPIRPPTHPKKICINAARTGGNERRVKRLPLPKPPANNSKIAKQPPAARSLLLLLLLLMLLPPHLAPASRKKNFGASLDCESPVCRNPLMPRLFIHGVDTYVGRAVGEEAFRLLEEAGVVITGSGAVLLAAQMSSRFLSHVFTLSGRSQEKQTQVVQGGVRAQRRRRREGRHPQGGRHRV